MEEITKNLRDTLPESFGHVGLPPHGWQEILETLYALTVRLRPSVVVETGVGIIGASSTFILQALKDNGNGYLLSIDPNWFRTFKDVDVGAGIPNRLRNRHLVLVGQSRRILKSVIDTRGPIQFFLHDGCHTYRNMLFEYETAWGGLSPEGIIASDDVRNSAFDRFTHNNGLSGVYVKYEGSEFALTRRSK
jgi:predicted O-methyltransferase YrrM